MDPVWSLLLLVSVILHAAAVGGLLFFNQDSHTSKASRQQLRRNPHESIAVRNRKRFQSKRGRSNREHDGPRSLLRKQPANFKENYPLTMAGTGALIILRIFHVKLDSNNISWHDRKPSHTSEPPRSRESDKWEWSSWPIHHTGQCESPTIWLDRCSLKATRREASRSHAARKANTAPMLLVFFAPKARGKRVCWPQEEHCATSTWWARKYSSCSHAKPGAARRSHARNGQAKNAKAAKGSKWSCGNPKASWEIQSLLWSGLGTANDFSVCWMTMVAPGLECWQVGPTAENKTKLDEGWPESVEEQGLLLLVWRHIFTNNIWKMCYRQSRRGVSRQNSEKCKTIVCIANTFTHRSFYTQTLLHTQTFTHRSFYTQKLLHRGFYTQSFYPQKLWHTEAFTYGSFYTQTLLHRHFYTQTRLHTDTFTHRLFYTQELLLHTSALTHRSFYT